MFINIYIIIMYIYEFETSCDRDRKKGDLCTSFSIFFAGPV